MPQITDLNVAPYYDDFDKEDNFHRVLFRPGFAIQGRELKVDRIIEITSKWEPFRSTACIVLWKWLDEGAIKFY